MIVTKLDTDSLYALETGCGSNQGCRLCLLLLAMFFDRHTWIIAFQPARFASTATAAETNAPGILDLAALATRELVL